MVFFLGSPGACWPTQRFRQVLLPLWRPCWALLTWWSARLQLCKQAASLTAAPGRVVPLTIVDVSAEVAQSLSPFEAEEPYELLVAFDPASPELVPEPAAALSLALAWIQDPSVEALDRVTFYSADEAPQAVPAKKPRPRLHLSRADVEAPAQPSGTTAADAVPKPKKPVGGRPCSPDGHLAGPVGPNRRDGPAHNGDCKLGDHRGGGPLATTFGRGPGSYCKGAATHAIYAGPAPWHALRHNDL